CRTVARLSDPCSLQIALNTLLGYATSQPCAAPAQGGRMICMIVATRMNHQGMALDVDELESGRQYRIVGVTRSIHEQRRKISKMSVTPRQAMPLGRGRIVVPARGQGRHHLAVLLLGRAAWIFMHMETMHSRWQSGKRGTEHDPIGCFGDDHLADRFSD